MAVHGPRSVAMTGPDHDQAIRALVALLPELDGELTDTPPTLVAPVGAAEHVPLSARSGTLQDTARKDARKHARTSSAA